ncbi:MAG TPA: ATP-binding cassette domain-containing protein [Gammaproteobacteria bacterium]|jgi:sodium transport system ATP-binding protein|nr:ATP-binding cassette domain-containing protein [Gammaproteobacteria bacterium]
MIEVEGVGKRFKEVVAVDSVSFNAADGRITGLLGENGAGKSTTLRMIATILRADRGTVRIDGVDVNRDAPAARARLGVLPHAHGLYARLTGRENIRYYGELNGLSGAALEHRIESLAARLDIGDFIDRRTEGFSHGQKMKIALARALIHDPKNVVLDEPTNGLDVMATRALRDVIRGLRAEGRCVLFSSHVMQEVAALCDDIRIIHNGRLVASGTPDALREQTGEADLEEAFVKAIANAGSSTWAA